MRTLNLIFKGMTLVVFMLVNSSADASDMLSTQSTEDLLNQAVEQYDDALFQNVSPGGLLRENASTGCSRFEELCLEFAAQCHYHSCL